MELVVVVFGCLSGGSLCRPYPPEPFIFSCGDFLFCRFSSSFRDLDYVGENAHDLFTWVILQLFLVRVVR